MSRPGNNRDNPDDEELRSINDISINSHSDSLRNASNIRIRDDHPPAISAQDTPATGNDGPNNEQRFNPPQTRDAVPASEGLANISTARYYPDPPRDCSQTEQRSISGTHEPSVCASVGGLFHTRTDVTALGSCTSPHHGAQSAAQASYRSQSLPRSQTNRDDLLTANSASDGRSGDCSFQETQNPEAVREMSSTGRHASTDESTRSCQTDVKHMANDRRGFPTSSSQETVVPTSGRDAQLEDATARSEASATANMCRNPNDPSDIDVILIGKTGNGKSATGNSILRRKAFKSSSSTGSVTKHIHYEICMFKDKIIKVVDAPGVGDTRLSDDKSVEMMQTSLQYAIACNPRGYNAFLLVFRYGVRFTPEERAAIAFLKGVFGKDFIKNFCILVVTCGDIFENDSEDTEQTFEQWLSNDDQDRAFKDLIRECENRVILFDNLTKDATKKESQLNDLLTLVDSLRFKYRYTDDNFREAARKQKELKQTKGKKKMINEEWFIKLSLVLQKFDELKNCLIPEQQVEPLQELSEETGQLYQELCIADNHTNDFKDFMELIQSLKTSLESKMEFLCHRLDDKENFEKEQKRLCRELAEWNEKYQEVKRQNDQSFLTQLVGVITWPLKKVKDWVLPQ